MSVMQKIVHFYVIYKTEKGIFEGSGVGTDFD